MGAVNKEKYHSFVLNIPLKLNEKHTKLANEMGVSKTTAIIFAMNYYIDYKERADEMKKALCTRRTYEDTNWEKYIK